MKSSLIQHIRQVFETLKINAECTVINTANDTLPSWKSIIDKLNHQQLTVEELESTEYQSISLATGKITKNPKDVHYRGYLRDAWGENEDKTAFLA